LPRRFNKPDTSTAHLKIPEMDYRLIIDLFHCWMLSSNIPIIPWTLDPLHGWYTVSGWWLTYPSEKYESQLGLLFPIYGKIKIVPTTNQV
jgi:hypothetical protein